MKVAVPGGKAQALPCPKELAHLMETSVLAVFVRDFGLDEPIQLNRKRSRYKLATLPGVSPGLSVLHLSFLFEKLRLDGAESLISALADQESPPNPIIIPWQGWPISPG